MDVRAEAAPGYPQPEVDHPQSEAHQQMLLRIGEHEALSRVLRGCTHECVDVRVTADDTV
jgi:hypothetical protein